MIRPGATTLGLILAAGCGGDGPPPVTTEAVTFAGHGLVLEGTLHVPPGALETPRAGILIIHGSGPVSRDGGLTGQLAMTFGFTVPVYTELAERLAAAGHVVLRYDKRTCTAPRCDNAYPPEDDAVLVDDFIADAGLALDFLASRPEVDPHRLVILGHSQGATLAPLVAQGRDDVAAIAMAAGPYRPIDALIADQATGTRARMEELGYDEALIQREIGPLELTVEALGQVREGTWAGGDILGSSVAFWQSWLDASDRAPDVAMTLSMPIIALSGDYDWNVPPSETEAWGARFDAAGSGHTAKVVPCVSHALNCISEPDWRQLQPSHLGQHVDQGFTDQLVDFLAPLQPRR